MWKMKREQEIEEMVSITGIGNAIAHIVSQGHR